MSALNQNLRMSGSPAMAVQRILTEWREAERQMARVSPEGDEYWRLRNEAERLRAAYREVLEGTSRRP